MPHKASNSLDSTTSSKSAASVELYTETLKPKIDAITKSSIALQKLVDKAEKIVNEMFTPDPRSNYTFPKRKVEDGEASVRLDKIMIAMLACAEECGGEDGKRYVAAAISSCSDESNVVDALAALGVTWLTHFLFIFRTSKGHSNQFNATPSDVATPTINETHAHLLEEVGPRKESFRDGVLKRDGYRCIITRAQDKDRPERVAGFPVVQLQAAHILRRAVGDFDNSPASDSYRSAATTFDILVNYTRLSFKALEDLKADLDHPSNGVTLQKDAHDAFDSFHWCLKKTDTENVYDLKLYQSEFLWSPLAFTRITFEDHTNDFSKPTNVFSKPTNDFSRPTRSSKAKKEVTIMPNVRYIEIHAAIAGILHMSGAGKFFDDLLDNYREDRDKVSGVRCWSELEKLMGEWSLTDSITEAFLAMEIKKYLNVT